MRQFGGPVTEAFASSTRASCSRKKNVKFFPPFFFELLPLCSRKRQDGFFQMRTLVWLGFGKENFFLENDIFLRDRKVDIFQKEAILPFREHNGLFKKKMATHKLIAEVAVFGNEDLRRNIFSYLRSRAEYQCEVCGELYAFGTSNL